MEINKNNLIECAIDDLGNYLRDEAKKSKPEATYKINMGYNQERAELVLWDNGRFGYNWGGSPSYGDYTIVDKEKPSWAFAEKVAEVSGLTISELFEK